MASLLFKVIKAKQAQLDAQDGEDPARGPSAEVDNRTASQKKAVRPGTKPVFHSAPEKRTSKAVLNATRTGEADSGGAQAKSSKATERTDVAKPKATQPGSAPQSSWRVGTVVHRGAQPGWPTDAALVVDIPELSSEPERSLSLGFSVGDKVTTPLGRHAIIVGVNKEPTTRSYVDIHGRPRAHLWAEYMKSSEPEASTSSGRLLPEREQEWDGSAASPTPSDAIIVPSRWCASDTGGLGAECASGRSPSPAIASPSMTARAGSASAGRGSGERVLRTDRVSSPPPSPSSSTYPLREHRSLRTMVRYGLPARSGFYLPGREAHGQARGSDLTSLPYLRLLYTRSEFDDMTQHDNFKTADWLRTLPTGTIVWSPTGTQMRIHEPLSSKEGRKMHLDRDRVWASQMRGRLSNTLTPLEEPVIPPLQHGSMSSAASDMSSRLSRACQFSVVRESRLLKDRITPMPMSPHLAERFRDTRSTPAAIATRCGFGHHARGATHNELELVVRPRLQEIRERLARHKEARSRAPKG